MMKIKYTVLGILICSTVISCDSGTLSQSIPSKEGAKVLPEQQVGTIGLGAKIDSLHAELVNKKIVVFDYKSDLLTFSNFEDSEVISLTIDNDKFGLISALPNEVLQRSHWIHLVGYFYTRDRYYVILNSWDNNSLYPIGYLVEIDPSFELKAFPVYAFDLDFVDDYQILKYSYFSPMKNGLTSFDLVYTGGVRYDQDDQIQNILPNLTEDQMKRYKGQGFVVTVVKEDGTSIEFRDVAWYRSSRIPGSDCFPEEVLDYIYLSSKNWYYHNIGGVPERWKFELEGCK